MKTALKRPKAHSSHAMMITTHKVARLLAIATRTTKTVRTTTRVFWTWLPTKRPRRSTVATIARATPAAIHSMCQTPYLSTALRAMKKTILTTSIAVFATLTSMSLSHIYPLSYPSRMSWISKTRLKSRNYVSILTPYLTSFHRRISYPPPRVTAATAMSWQTTIQKSPKTKKQANFLKRHRSWTTWSRSALPKISHHRRLMCISSGPRCAKPGKCTVTASMETR